MRTFLYPASPQTGRAVRQAREGRHLTRSECAKKLGMTTSNLAKIESGARAVTAASARKLIALLGPEPAEKPAPESNRHAANFKLKSGLMLALSSSGELVGVIFGLPHRDKSA